jgi:DNA repair protein RadC
MAISEWPVAERPRERLLAQGPAVLTDAELVAILLRSGVRGKSAVELAREMLAQYGGVKKMLEAGAELSEFKGLGPAKTAQFAAALELARRSLREELKQDRALTSPGAVRDYLAAWSTKCSCASGSMPSTASSPPKRAFAVR